MRSIGVGKESIVGILAEKSLEMIIGIYGILKSGAAYVPIAPDFPKARIQYILEDCGAKALLIYQADYLTEKPVLDLGDSKVFSDEKGNLSKIAEPDDIAYVIYTSGTTGSPKGVMVAHRGIVNLVEYYKTGLGITESDRVSQFASVTFDAAVSEINMALSIGGTLYVFSREEIENIPYFVSRFNEEKITIATFPPAYYRQLSNIQTARMILTAGSESDMDIVKKCDAEVYLNAYGPTEASICTTDWKKCKGQSVTELIPIGRPIANMQVYIVNHDSLCGIGIPGELCIAGDGLAKGYLNQPELTVAKFIKNPFGEGKLYRSGDLAKWLPDGNIEYLGRIDEQVKIRGFRIELGEIESALRCISSICDAVVMAKKNHMAERILYAYIVSEEKENISLIREELRKVLPEYMVPGIIIQIDQIPVTKNGKVDRKALENIQIQELDTYIAPINDVEIKITTSFGEILGFNRVSMEANFFEFGGNSLSAIRLVNTIEEKTGIRLSVNEVFTNPTPFKLSKLLEEKGNYAYGAIPVAPKQEYYKMSSAQRRMYLLHEIDNTKLAYNMPLALRVKGNLDIDRVREAVFALVERHESLRTSFHIVDDIFVQKIEKQVCVDFLFTRINSLPSTELLLVDFEKPFDLSKAPLFRMHVFGNEQESIILIDAHHIIMDGSSMQILLQEFSDLYVGNKLKPLNIQYKDYSEWFWKKDLTSQKEYWLNKFSGDIPVLDLHCDFPRPQVQHFEGRSISRELPVEISDWIKETAKESGVTEFMQLLSAFMILLSKYSRQNEIIVGTPLVGRTHKDTEGVIGMFVNSLAIKGIVNDSETWRNFLLTVRDECIASYDNQEYPFEELVEHVHVTRSISRNPIFDVMFSFQNSINTKIDLGNFAQGFIETSEDAAKFDINLTVIDNQKGYQAVLTYATSLYKDETAELILDHYIQLLLNIKSFPDQEIARIGLITEVEKRLILEQFNSTLVPYSEGQTILDLFEKQVRLHPDNIAVSDENEQITFGELNERANRGAGYLQELGVTGQIIPIIIGRSTHILTAMLSVLKAGAAYLPVDPQNPYARIAYIVEDCRAKCVMTDLNIKAALTGAISVPLVVIEDIIATEHTYCKLPVRGEDLSYVIYTSGSTGKPKGTALTHRNLLNFCKNNIEVLKSFKKAEHAVMVSTTSISFDIFITESLLPIINGIHVVVANEEEQLDQVALSRLVFQQGITLFQTTPSKMRMLMADEDKRSYLGSLNTIILGGEVFPGELYDTIRKYSDCDIFNIYGPSETTVWATTSLVCSNQVTIGHPYSNTQIYILDHGHLCGIGMPGELCIAGDCVGAGYLYKPELTEEKFVINPFGKGRMYHSGDLARWLPDGNIEYLGRIDDQIKIRGLRIELGEIESSLRNIMHIRDAAVITREDKFGDQILCAYIVSEEQEDFTSIRNALREMLPEYMVPSHIMQIEHIPVTRNGKLDKRALPEIELSITENYIAPRNDVEKSIISIFENVLGVDRLSVDANFFEMGGDSIKAIRVVSKLRDIGYAVTAKDIMQLQTSERIARSVKFIGKEVEYNQDPISGEVPLSPIQKQFFEWNLVRPEHFNQSVMLETDANFDSEVFQRALKRVVAHHDMLRAVYPKGVQFVLSIEEIELDVEEVILGDESRLEELCDLAQASIRLNDGPLFKSRIFRTDQKTYILLIVHHLVIDGISWRILLEDINSSYRQLQSKQEVKLPLKTASYAMWVDVLKEYSEIISLSNEREYWNAIEKKARKGRENTGKEVNYHNIERRLNTEWTKKLMYDTETSYGTEINDLLLVALSGAIETVTGCSENVIDVESHGREELHRAISIDRTIGWFTSIYPVVLQHSGDIEDDIIETKEMLRHVPNHGIGYSLIRFYGKGTRNEFCKNDFCFNYLGEFQAEHNDGLFKKSEKGCGREIDSNNRLGHAVAINCSIIGGEFIINILYDRNLYETREINILADTFIVALQNIIENCTSRSTVIKTASDIGLQDASEDEIDSINDFVSEIGDF